MNSDIIGIVTFSVIAASAIFSSRRNNTRTVKVSEIWIYPIKSCGGIRVDKANITRRGFQYDRMLMIVDKDGKFVTQRSYPNLALVKTKITKGNMNGMVVDILTVSHQNMDDLVIPLVSQTRGPLFEVTVWGDKCQAFEVVEGSFWFREYLDKEGLKLVQMEESNVRSTDPEFAPEGETGFADGFPFLLISQESLDGVNQHLENKVPMNRFRPNIVVSGCLAYEEDAWKSIVFHSEEVIAMNVVKPCSRCTIPNIDQATGIPDASREPSFTMKRFRSGASIGLKKESWQKQVFFGQNLDHMGRSCGLIQVGDVVEAERA